MNRLLKRQLKKHFGKLNSEDKLLNSTTIKALLDDINQAYDFKDKELRLLGRTVDISSHELNTANDKLKESEQNLNRAQVISKIGSWYYDLDSETEVWSDECFEIFGLKKDDYPDNIVPESLRSTLYANSEELEKFGTSLAEKHDTYELELTTVPINGKVKTIQSYCEVERDNDGNILKVFGTDQDITERKYLEDELKKHRDHLEELIRERTAELEKEITKRKHSETALSASRERMELAMKGADMSMWDWNIVKDEIVFDLKSEKLLEYAPSKSEDWFKYLHPDDLSEVKEIDEAVTKGQSDVVDYSYRIFSKTGEIKWIHTWGRVVEWNKDGKPMRATGTIRDITESKLTEEEVRFIAFHDTLTGLPNRKSFYMRLEDKLANSPRPIDAERRQKNVEKCMLLFLDLNKFKNVNDLLGHDAGDELLKVVATRIQSCLRKSDYLFRLGGDEFTIILDNIRHGSDAAKVAEKVQEAISHKIIIKGHDFYIDSSIGISVYPEDGKNVETLVKNADMAMYAAKNTGERYHFFTEEMNRKVLERMKLETNLRTALQDNQFKLYYQQFVDKTGQIVGAEALLRWFHPEMGLIGPTEFIPLAEETGVIVPIGKWVLKTACRQVKKWHDMGYKDFYVAVNLSPRQFNEPDLIETVDQTLEITGIPPHCLRLEVTESSIMDDPDQATQTMQLIRDKGIRFAIDDFGTGYSSLSYLKQFPIDSLKIDRSFVKDSLTNKDDQEIIKTIIAMADGLNMNIVAEGIENEGQHDFLVSQGCQIMQGYYHGRPVSAKKFKMLLGT